MAKAWYTVAAVAFLVIALGLAGNADLEEAKAQRERYCDMVQIYERTGGDAGWPPYDGECE